ncbi:Kelch protein 18 [Fasciolopsis buskii]|uniref:Kelch protein 18 n=1 Tax=Fasciolopsis buskii TaxID=27845 RepID=A0A8E0VRU9_9TREM|nr:Kelch protein 18 [Fasciolopsis buski]
MFLSNMSESNKNEISILGLDSCALEAFICFAYSGFIQITPYNVQSLLIGASFLQLNSIREICCKYIEERLSPPTVLTVRSFAQSFMCMNLAAACDNYIFDHFDAVSQTEAFLTIGGDDLLTLLDSDELCVSSEERLFQLIIDWVEYENQGAKKTDSDGNRATSRMDTGQEISVNKSICNYVDPPNVTPYSSSWSFTRPLSSSDPCLSIGQTGHSTESTKSTQSRLSLLPELLKRVRLPLIPASYISAVISKHPLIRENMRCRDLLDEVRDMLLLRDVAVSSFSCRPRRGQEVYGIIYAVGGLTSTGDCHGAVETYHPSLGRWELAEHMPSQRSRIGVVGLNGRLYAIGGFDGISRLNTTEVYDPKTKAWETLAPMNHKRSALGAAALDGQIYVCGGYDGIASLKSCEVYNPIQNKWYLIPSMREPRSAGGLVALSNGCLYAVGGHNGLAIYSSVECCNRRGSNLTLRTTSSAGSNSSATRFGGTNAWYPVSRMIHKRCRHGVTVLRNLIIVAGGYNGVTFLRSVEVFNPAAGPNQDGLMGQWTEIAPLEVPRSRVGLAVTGGRLYAIGGYDGFSHLRTVECFQPPPSHADPPIARVSQSPADTCLGRRSRSSNETAMQGDSSNRGWMRCTANTSQSNAQRDTLSRPTSSDEEASSGSTQSSSTNTATSLEPTVSCLEGMTRMRSPDSQFPTAVRGIQGIFANWRWTQAAPLIAHEGWVGVGVLPLCGEVPPAPTTPVNKAFISVVPGCLHDPVLPSQPNLSDLPGQQSLLFPSEFLRSNRGQTG